MADLKTTYMGLELKNPVIVGSSGLTSNLESIKKCHCKKIKFFDQSISQYAIIKISSQPQRN